MNLFEIDSAILSCVDFESGEIFDEDKFIELQMSREMKIENLCLYIKNLRAEIAALKAEKDAFAKRQKQAERKEESLRNYLTAYLDGEKFESTRATVSFRKSESLEISKDSEIPEDFLRFKKPEVNKEELTRAIKAGQQFKGVYLVENQNIQIR